MERLFLESRPLVERKQLPSESSLLFDRGGGVILGIHTGNFLIIPRLTLEAV